jgi:hypothetical protein
VRPLTIRAVLCALAGLSVAAPATVRRVTWDDIPPAVRTWLDGRGVHAAGFPDYLERVRTSNQRRVAEGDLDHLIFYALQSTRFTTFPPIEPALSAKALVDSFDPAERAAFLASPTTAPPARVPDAVRTRLAALGRALEKPEPDERLQYFHEIAEAAYPRRPDRERGLLREYLRAMRFVYEKEVAARALPHERVAELYRTRGLSTDTAVEAGYLIYLGLGIVRALDAARTIRRVLIVGPGLDLAPRTGFREAGPPESYQPWTVIDALVSVGLARTGELEVVAADINPRVVAHLNRARAEPPALTLVSELGDNETVTLTSDFREYFAGLGGAVGTVAPMELSGRYAGHLGKSVRVDRQVATALRACALDIVTERIGPPGFDLIVITNVLPYFDDVDLTLALTNMAAMLVEGGVLLHNESRPLLGEITERLGLPMAQSRHATIATVRGKAAPLSDSVWIHVRR